MDTRQTIVPGATVFDVNAEKMGTIVAANAAYIVVAKGFFFPKDYYIPVSAIDDTD
jgi:hypothetical protein